MRRMHRQDQSDVGEDSFLDTTANLVGILIILVVVIGTKTRVDAEEYGRRLASVESQEQFIEPRRKAVALAQSLEKQHQDMERHRLELEYRRQERDALLFQVAQAREKVAEDRESASREAQENAELESTLAELEDALDDAETQMGSLVDAPRPKVLLEHLPTPMAKTVFTREMHVLLKNQRVTVVPWDQLVGMLREQVPLAARRSGSRTAIDDTLGPIGGFLMRYRMLAVPGGFELDRFELQDTPQIAAESLEEAMAPAGRLRLELASRDPGETVVTVWVYPDSFEIFRQLKSRLFAEGFLSAARPMPEGLRISASPRGSRSSAQ